MKTRLILSILAAAIGLPAAKNDARAQVDLATAEGVALVKGQWRYHDTKIVETTFAGRKTYDYEPHAGGAEFDDSQWPAIAATSLEERRGFGRIGFNWYRIRITVPEKIGDFDPTGSTVSFETSVDDYAEIWVDGELTRAPGQSGGSVVAGWNALNRLVIARRVKPGQQIQLAVFGINGPISNPPTNFIYLRSAKLTFAAGEPAPVAIPMAEVNVEVKRFHPAMDEIVGPNPKIHKLAEGFEFTEGPVWVRDGGYLLFSDPNANTIYRYQNGELSVFRTPSGYAGADIAEYRQPGSNGLALDAQGRLTIDQHGNRRVIRLEAGGGETVLADRYEGKRLNSPNDLVYRSDGTLFFTDPPFGLPKFAEDRRKELAFSGVYAVKDGRLRLLTKEFSGPNGIALSPDEKTLYVGNWDDHQKVVMRYDLAEDGSISNGRVLADLTSTPGEDAIDGVKTDQRGNVYISGPGGLHVYSAAGEALGLIIAPKHPHNFAWGGDDGRTLFLCARSGLYQMRLNIPGRQ